MTGIEAIVLALVVGGASTNLLIQFVRGEPRPVKKERDQWKRK